jgi:hypothetical protein
MMIGIAHNAPLTEYIEGLEKIWTVLSWMQETMPRGWAIRKLAVSFSPPKLIFGTF